MNKRSIQRIWICAGTAGELIKLYPIIKEIEKYPQQLEWRFLFTGQSPCNFRRQWEDFGLNDQFIVGLVSTKTDLKNISHALKWFLRGILTSSQELQTKIKNTFGFEPKKNEIWVVHGDTLSTLMGAKWCTALHGRLAHVEAGLRSASIVRPFPEEITRRLVSRLTKIHFPQDEFAKNNLKIKSTKSEIISTNGNTLYDTLQLLGKVSHVESESSNTFVLVNIHRNENLSDDKRWQIIINTICKAAVHNHVRMVLHPPTSQKLLRDTQSNARLKDAGVELLPRIIFSQFIKLIHNARYVITDGGSNQEECAYLGKPCLILRTETERLEGLTKNCLLSKFEPELINNFIENPEKFQHMPTKFSINPSSKIVARLLS
jgi:UDP-N-acetylglucosamine 2-epimerase (non-hydrolysing)